MTDDEAAIRRVAQTWMSATKAGDLETVLGLMTEDVVFLVAGQAPMIGRAAYAAAARSMQANGAPTFDGTSEIQEIQVHGDWAFMWSTLSVVVTLPAGAAPIRRSGHTLTVLRKVGGRWLLARDANLLVTVPNA